MSKQVVLGIDPGTTVTGYGILLSEKGKISVLDYGAIRPTPTLELNERYWIIFSCLLTLIRKFQPDAVAIETQFMSKNPQSAIKLGMARGCAILAAKQSGLEIAEFTPTKAKKAVTGVGGASKEQVGAMIARLLNLSEPPTPADAADALALAFCFLNAQTIQV